MVLTEKTCE